MITQPFRYVAPRSSSEAAALLAEAPARSTLLGGGTWVVPEMQQGLRSADQVVDLRRAGLGGVAADDGEVTVGATTTYRDLLGSPVVAEQLPLLAAMARTVTGGPPLHNQGTIGGSVCAARPSSDALGAVVTAGGQAVVEGPAGRRRIPATDLVRSVRTTVLDADELLVALVFPGHSGWGVGYEKLKRGTSGWPLVTASAMVGPVGPAAREIRVTVAGVTAVPVVVDGGGLAAALEARSGRKAAVEDAVRSALAGVQEPYTDELASGAYRLKVAPAIAWRALARALDDAGLSDHGGATR